MTNKVEAHYEQYRNQEMQERDTVQEAAYFLLSLFDSSDEYPHGYGYPDKIVVDGETVWSVEDDEDLEKLEALALLKRCGE